METAHQIVNTGDDELRYLPVSTQRAPEVWEYPDSGKFGFTSDLSTRGGDQAGVLRYFGREAHGADYWDGE